MTNEMRQQLAREPFEEKIRKVAQLIHLARCVRRIGKHAEAIERQFLTGSKAVRL
jgi:hypothetical protein